MGKAELKRNHDQAAVTDFREALRRDPNDFQSLTFLARTLAASSDPQVRNGTEAATLARQAMALVGEQPLVLDVLGMAQAEAGQFAEAQQSVQRAFDISAADGETNSLPRLRERLQQYQANKPWRESATNAP
jgi:cytochrome c-type biogenesis protein CcmH